MPAILFERITDLALGCTVTYILGPGETVTNTKIRLQIQSDESPWEHECPVHLNSHPPK